MKNVFTILCISEKNYSMACDLALKKGTNLGSFSSSSPQFTLYEVNSCESRSLAKKGLLHPISISGANYWLEYEDDLGYCCIFDVAL